MDAEGLVKFLDSEEFMRATTNFTKLTVRLKASIEKGELYEMHQILKMVHSRLIRSEDRVPVLIKLLQLSSTFLMSKGEVTSAQDVSRLLSEASKKLSTFDDLD